MILGRFFNLMLERVIQAAERITNNQGNFNTNTNKQHTILKTFIITLKHQYFALPTTFCS